jgi:sortase B
MTKTRKIIFFILLLIAIVCLIVGCIFVIRLYTEKKQYEETLDASRIEAELIADINDALSDIPDTSEPETDSEEVSDIPETPAVLNPYAESFLANEDMAGWLIIPGTNIDYPVMWTPGDENYYLYKDFNKNANDNGCLLLDTDSSLDPLTTNLIIHGHNMKSGAMFGNLTDYEKEDYYKEHKQIILHTKECQKNYEVIAVFRSQVYKKSDDVFKFYKFFEATTEEEFDDFYNNIKDLSLYDTGITAEYGDNFITLSTCVYHVTNGRFVVVAKEVDKGNTYLPLED